MNKYRPEEQDIVTLLVLGCDRQRLQRKPWAAWTDAQMEKYQERMRGIARRFDDVMEAKL